MEDLYQYASVISVGMLVIYGISILALGYTYYKHNNSSFTKLVYKVKEVTFYCFIAQTAIVLITLGFYLFYTYIIPYYEQLSQQ